MLLFPYGRIHERTGKRANQRGIRMKAIIAYVGIAYSLSIALSLLVGLTGGHDGRIFGLAYLSMFLPAFAVSIVYLAMKEAPLVSWDRPRLKYLLVATFLMPVVLH